MARKPGTCTGCGAPTQRTSSTRCTGCAKEERTLPRLLMEPQKRFKEQLRQQILTDGRAALADMVADAKTKMPRPKNIKRQVGKGVLLELSIPDLHLGKLAWGEETGGANYDSRIATRLYHDAVETLLARTAHYAPERIVLTVGNDFFHSDTKAGTTTGGTPLDNDSRFQKMFTTGRRLLTETIERLRHIAPVTVPIVPGNHDTLSAFTLGEALDCWFHRYKDVTILNQPTPRKYLQFGQVMLLWTHGDKGKLDQLPLLMATEQPQMFGATTFREAHVGHLHTLRAKEIMGVRVRHSPALCSADAWHAENQFVGNLRQAEAFVWDRREGLIGQAFFTAGEK